MWDHICTVLRVMLELEACSIIWLCRPEICAWRCQTFVSTPVSACTTQVSTPYCKKLIIVSLSSDLYITVSLFLCRLKIPMMRLINVLLSLNSAWSRLSTLQKGDQYTAHGSDHYTAWGWWWLHGGDRYIAWWMGWLSHTCSFVKIL
jgi:hypothetical protein